LDAALRKSDAIRAELAKATTLDTQPRHRVKGYVSRGQGHGGYDFSSLKRTERLILLVRFSNQ
ncbi:hypothetical protein, partial [Pseudomonas syringae]